jgi:glyoxylate reductase
VKVLITRDIPQAGVSMLKEHSELEVDIRKGPPLSTEELLAAIAEVEAIIPVIPDKITKEIIEAGKNLKLVATYSVGYDHIDLQAATERKIYVSNTPGDLTEAVAEHAFALMMAVGRKVAAADKFVRAGAYKYWDPMIFLGPKLAGKTLGIVGFGRIGQKFAEMARDGLDMRIVYCDVLHHGPNTGATRMPLDKLLGVSDVVSLHCNLSESTKHLIGEKELHAMKPNAFIINTARGPVINEKVLVTALREGWIEGAGLDVFEEEPKVHPELLDMDTVVLTPHIASATREARIQMARMAAQNVIDVLIKGNTPRNLVNKELLPQ